ncbi:MAG: hypothetical protein AAFY65_15870 [Pseudomonadota bacterium]
MRDHGPSRRETIFYLCASLAGLALMGVALAVRGVGGAVALEVIVIAGGFFGGTTIWAARRLWRMSQ